MSVDPETSSITLHWTIPEITGGDDFYYVISYSVNGENFVIHDGHYVDHNLMVDYTINGLRPSTRYTVRVSAENTVSDQDSGNRTCSSVTRSGGAEKGNVQINVTVDSTLSNVSCL